MVRYLLMPIFLFQLTIMIIYHRKESLSKMIFYIL